MHNFISFLDSLCVLTELNILSVEEIKADTATSTEAVCFKLAEPLFHSSDSRDVFRRVAEEFKNNGFSSYVCHYIFSNSSLLVENDNFIQRYQPYRIVFIKDSLYKKIEQNIQSFIKEAALANILSFGDDNTNVSGLVKLPLVSIVITSYNYEKYIDECISSVVEQDYPYIQRIVVDDCSTDNSVERVLARTGAVEVVENETNGGQLKSMFAGLEKCNGEFVVFVDADDLMDSRAVSGHLYIHLFQKQNVAFSCVRNSQISENGSLINNFHLDFASHDEEIVYVKPRVIHTPTWSWSTTSAMMFRIDILKLIKTGNTELFRICADYYVVHFANLLGGSLLFDKALVNYRRHGKNNFSKNMIIGGHRPTGHSEVHNHPEHISLQNGIISHMLENIDTFEPYFSTTEKFAQTLGYVMEPKHIIRNYSLQNKMRNSLMKAEKHVRKVCKSQIRKKRIVIVVGNMVAFYRSIKIRISSYVNTHCEK